MLGTRDRSMARIQQKGVRVSCSAPSNKRVCLEEPSLTRVNSMSPPSYLNKRGRWKRPMNRKTKCCGSHPFHIKRCIHKSSYRYYHGCHYSRHPDLQSKSRSNNKSIDICIDNLKWNLLAKLILTRKPIKETPLTESSNYERNLSLPKTDKSFSLILTGIFIKLFYRNKTIPCFNRLVDIRVQLPNYYTHCS